MITHSAYQAANPLPSGATFKDPRTPICEPRQFRAVSPLGKYSDGCTKESKELLGAIVHSERAAAARVKLYRSVMGGKGWLTVADMFEATGICAKSIRHRMITLQDTGHVERRNSGQKVHYRWIETANAIAKGREHSERPA